MLLSGCTAVESLLRHKCPKEAPQKRQNTPATARCATAVLETQRQGLPLSPSLIGQNVEAAQITSPVDLCGANAAAPAAFTFTLRMLHLMSPGYCIIAQGNVKWPSCQAQSNVFVAAGCKHAQCFHEGQKCSIKYSVLLMGIGDDGWSVFRLFTFFSE